MGSLLGGIGSLLSWLTSWLPHRAKPLEVRKPLTPRELGWDEEPTVNTNSRPPKAP